MKSHLIAGDFHCKYQKVAWLDPNSGEMQQADLNHNEMEDLRRFYSRFAAESVVAMEASGYSFCFEQLIDQLGLQLWVGHPGYIAAKRVRKQKNDNRDAEHILDLLLRQDFPRVWRPDPQQRTQKSVIRYRVKLVQERTRWINTLRALVYKTPRRRLDAAKQRLADDIVGIAAIRRTFQGEIASPADQEKSASDASTST